MKFMIGCHSPQISINRELIHSCMILILVQMNAPLSTMMRSPPPCVTTTTSIGHVVDLILQQKYKMVIVVKHSNLNGTTHGSRAVGVFTAEQLVNLMAPVPEVLKQKHSLWRRLTMF